MSLALFKTAAAVAAILAALGSEACAQVKQQVQKQAHSPQAAFALLFLSRLERGQTAQAHRMLAPTVAREFPAGKLASFLPAGSKVPVARRIRKETVHPLGLAFADRLNRVRTGKSLTGVTAYLVCLADVPRSGYGRINYITVVLLQGRTTSNLQISEFRFRSQPEDWCE